MSLYKSADIGNSDRLKNDIDMTFYVFSQMCMHYDISEFKKINKHINSFAKNNDDSF